MKDEAAVWDGLPVADAEVLGMAVGLEAGDAVGEAELALLCKVFGVAEDLSDAEPVEKRSRNVSQSPEAD